MGVHMKNGNPQATGYRRPLVIAGTASGVGKTTIAAGIMGALRQRGLMVAPFKVGPDYIDPGYHMAVTGVPSRNLDTWLTSPEAVRSIYDKGAAAADVSVVEGAMGLFDGRSGAGARGSTAEIAAITGGAVVLVVDCSRMAYSLAPLLSGFSRFDPRLFFAGAILNNAGSPGHARMLEDAARQAGVPVLGVFPRDPGISLKSRHLGLVPAGGQGGTLAGDLPDVLEQIIKRVDENIDIDALLAAAGDSGDSNSAASGDTILNSVAALYEGTMPNSGIKYGVPKKIRLAVACDEAFSFYYADSLEALEDAGAEVIYFSPLRDQGLPACDGVYLGGGFPEVYAAELESNVSMRHSLAGAAGDGLPVYAECGGLVYLCRSMEVDGKRHKMAGALPLKARMTGRRQALGYVEATALRDSILLGAGEQARGHEFHWSAIEWSHENLAYDCFSARESARRPGGFCNGNLLASYVHIHFAGNLNAATRFVDACAGAKGATVEAIV